MANKIALITGATSGIGEACARRFAQGGYDLILTGRNTGKLEIIKKELENAYGIMVLALAFDVRNREAAQKAVNYIPSHMKNIDVLINNAGLARGLEPEYEGDFEDWDQMIDTNIKGLLTMTRLIVQCLLCHQGCRQGNYRRTPYRRGSHQSARHQCKTRIGGNQFLQHPLPWRQRPCRQSLRRHRTAQW